MSCSLHARLMVVVVATALVASCGGGGGGGGGGAGNGGGNNGGGSSTSTDPAVSIDTRTFSVSATAWDQGQSRVARLTVQNLPSNGAWVYIDGSENGVSYVDFFAESATAAQLIVEFRPGAQVMPGTYRDTITVSVCADEQCATQFRNSPITLSTTLVVAGGESSIASLEGPVSATISKRAPPPTLPVDSTAATVGSPGPIAPYIVLANSSELLQSVVAVMETTSRVRLDTTFKSAFGLQRGEHTETVMLKACYDSSCLRQLAGSPFSLPVTYLVTDDVPPEPGIEPLPYLSRMALAHDVIDSEYSPQLHAIVMVSTYPRNSLYLFDLVTQDERELELNKAPKSVSIAPDGTQAAVGHDALVSVVDLAQLRQTGTTTPLLLNISTVAFDIVMDGRGFVHVFPEYDQWVNLHTVEIATNTETLSTGGSVRAGTHGRLHPSGDYIYGADNGLSPSDIEKYDIRGGTAVMLYDSPYHGDHGMCGNVWMKEDGHTIYTPCGNTFTSSTTQAQDMVYSGKLELSKNQYYSFLITSLSHSSESKEIALIETDNSCFGDESTCYSHLAIYESDFLNRQSVHSIAPIRVAGSDYAQRGLFVFHSADGQHRYMVSRLLDAQDPDSEFYLTIVN